MCARARRGPMVRCGLPRSLLPYVAKGVASSVALPGRKQSSAGAIADACLWAIASAGFADVIVVQRAACA